MAKSKKWEKLQKDKDRILRESGITPGMRREAEKAKKIRGTILR